MAWIATSIESIENCYWYENIWNAVTKFSRGKIAREHAAQMLKDSLAQMRLDPTLPPSIPPHVFYHRSLPILKLRYLIDPEPWEDQTLEDIRDYLRGRLQEATIATVCQ